MFSEMICESETQNPSLQPWGIEKEACTILIIMIIFIEPTLVLIIKHLNKLCSTADLDI